MSPLITKEDLSNHLSDRLGYEITSDKIKKFKILELNNKRWIFVKMEIGDYGDIETHLINANDNMSESYEMWEEKDNFKWNIDSLISYIKENQ